MNAGWEIKRWGTKLEMIDQDRAGVVGGIEAQYRRLESALYPPSFFFCWWPLLGYNHYQHSYDRLSHNSQVISLSTSNDKVR